MHSLAGWGLAVLVLAGLTERACGDDPAARAVLTRAIREQGGADALLRTAHATRHGKGTFFFEQPTSFTTTETLSLPDRLRLELTVDKTIMARVLKGDKGWEQVNGSTLPMGRNRLTEVQEEAYVWWLTTLAPLLKADFDLARLPEERINDRAAVGIKVSARGRPDCALYFDKDNGQLVKIARRAAEGGAVLSKEYVYSDYKAIDGAHLPMRETVFVNGRKFSEITYTDYQLLRAVDEKAFEKP